MNFSKILLGALFCFIWCMISACGFVIAAQANADPALNEDICGIEQRYRTLNDLCAHFTQEAHIGSLKQVEHAEGTVCFKKGGKMYWEYKKPTVQKIYLDGDTLWFYLPEDNQAMKNDASRLPSDITAQLFAGTLSIRDTFNVAYAEQNSPDRKGNAVIALTPKLSRPDLKRLTLWADRKTYYIYQSALEDELGNKTILKFSRIKINKGVADSVFSFTPPPGVEIFEPPVMSVPNPS